MAEIVITAAQAQMVWGIISILFGVIILVAPKILNYLIALYFIISGLFLVLPLI